jgi:hypothetical protein
VSSVSSCQACLTRNRSETMHCRQTRGAGLTFLGCGIAFLAIGYSGQPAFIGVGFSFIGLSLALIAKFWRS